MLSSQQEDCSAKLADFGLAQSLKDQSRGGSKAGTAGYVAPEIIDGGAFGPASDMWALGCLLYAMLTVSLPFPVVSAKKTDAGSPVKSQQQVDYSKLDLNYAQIDDDSKDLLLQLLVQDPTSRLTADEVLQHPFVRSS